MKKYKTATSEELLQIMIRPEFEDCHKYGTRADIERGEVGRIGDVYYIEKNG